MRGRGQAQRAKIRKEERRQKAEGQEMRVKIKEAGSAKGGKRAEGRGSGAEIQYQRVRIIKGQSQRAEGRE